MDQPPLDLPALRAKYQPHWVWFLSSVAIPVGLLIVSFLGIGLGSPVPFGLAATAPKVALGVSGGVLGAALIKRRKAPIEIASLGLTLSALGCVLLWWLTG